MLQCITLVEGLIFTVQQEQGATHEDLSLFEERVLFGRRKWASLRPLTRVIVFLSAVEWYKVCV